MSRLYLKFYFALLGSLAVFAFAAIVVWHVAGLADEGDDSMLSRVVQNALPPADAPAAQQQAALRALLTGLDVDALLVAPDHTHIATVGHNIDHGWAIDLPDGRHVLSNRPLSGHPQYMLLLVLLVLALTVGVAAYPLVRHIATRLERLQVGVEALGAGDLSARVAVEGHDEVAHLAASFNRAATRIDELVAAHKSLLANASHELRTPLTRIRLTVELMKTSADPQRKRALNQDIAELDQLIDEILLASRLDAITEPDVEEDVDLLALATAKRSLTACRSRFAVIRDCYDACCATCSRTHAGMAFLRRAYTSAQMHAAWKSSYATKVPAYLRISAT